MQLGRRLHELWHLRVGLTVSVLLAALAALWSVQDISLSPPGLTSRHLSTSTASTSALVDTPRSTVLNIGVTTGDFLSITNRALLISNVMASSPVRAFIARRAGVPENVIQVSSPVTPDWPRPLDRPGQRRETKDILKSPDEYRVSLRSNPTVPTIDVYATAPSPEAAARLANGAVQGTRDYLRALADQQRIPPAQQVQLQQLGTATGDTINARASLEFAALSFLVVFATSAATALFVARVRRGWKLESQAAVANPAVGA